MFPSGGRVVEDQGLENMEFENFGESEALDEETEGNKEPNLRYDDDTAKEVQSGGRLEIRERAEFIEEDEAEMLYADTLPKSNLEDVTALRCPPQLIVKVTEADAVRVMENKNKASPYKEKSYVCNGVVVDICKYAMDFEIFNRTEFEGVKAGKTYVFTSVKVVGNSRAYSRCGSHSKLRLKSAEQFKEVPSDDAVQQLFEELCPEEKFSKVSEILEGAAALVNVKGIPIFLGEVSCVPTRYGERLKRRVVLADSTGQIDLLLWGDMTEMTGTV